MTLKILDFVASADATDPLHVVNLLDFANADIFPNGRTW
jgi:hypothetical protein